MISKSTRARLFAVLCGIPFGMLVGLVLSLSMGVTLRLLPNTDAAIWEPVSYVLAWVVVTLFAAGLAALYGAYDLLVIVTCIIPALLFFGSSYWMDVSALKQIERNSMYLILGVISPFDFFGQATLLIKLLALALSASAAGIALKHWIFRAYLKSASAELTPVEGSQLRRGIALDLFILLFVMAAFLRADLCYQVQASPGSKLAELYHSSEK